ncbi:D-alanyl-D-alanine carboxypeptidase [Streptosporangium subroseum]|uniref:D-alanyl-D-alanine carboxypeptidase n=1 Tax=Streptosporangium subroseum TaxID=106412 RepID=A0A239ES71_9ACTN|nr:serine hydrolase domain-containing protein [Streptosporangium subroseum]SNS47477.1 D-alanyl-D-alanine carboxypeptidase [Streptosporangium subroseum]
MSHTPTQPTSPRRPRRMRGRILAAAALTALTGLTVAGLPVASANAATGPGHTPDVVREHLERLVDDAGLPAAMREAKELAHRRTADVVQQRLNHLVKSGAFPAALASTRDAKGRTRDYTAGVADLKTRAKVPVDGQVRIASNTKMFTAVVVLQLAGEGKIDLDAPIEKYLPGLIRGNGNDGRKITTRQLLQHTSGLPNYTRYMPSVFEYRHTYVGPREMLDTALAHKASFAPGKDWEYSNTGYIVAGLLVQKITGRPLSEEITNRIIKRIGLRDTYWPGVGDQTIRGSHPKGYAAKKPGGPLLDVTNLDPSWGWAAGQLIATPSDVNRFLVALLDGKLLKPEQLTQMRETVKTKGMPSGWQYGLGLVKMPLSCGGSAWGHGGDIDGYETRDAVTEDGRAATVAVTALPTDETGVMGVVAAVDAALCANR